MRICQGTFGKLKRLFIGAFSIYMTVPLKFKDVFQGFCCVRNFLHLSRAFWMKQYRPQPLKVCTIIHTLDIAKKNDGFRYIHVNQKRLLRTICESKKFIKDNLRHLILSN